MRTNLDRSFGLYFSQHVLLALIDAGLSRDEAYRIVQEAAMRAWDEERPYVEILKENARVTDAVSLDEIFDDTRFTKHLGVVFERLDAVEF
jgi:adenylosuccinate lyase